MLEASIGKFTYDSANRLITADTRYYAYDVEGTRIKTQKGEDTTEFVYNVNARLSQLLVKTENNAVTKYVYGLGLIGEETSGNFKTYHFDYRGSTVAITNANGTVTDTFEYDTYGKLTAHSGSNNTQFLYNGRDGVLTEDNGLIYMRARYYSTALRRFINADKVHGDISNALTLNRYSFCNGDPANGVDPEGLSWERSGSDVGTNVESTADLSKIKNNINIKTLNIRPINISSITNDNIGGCELAASASWVALADRTGIVAILLLLIALAAMASSQATDIPGDILPKIDFRLKTKSKEETKTDVIEDVIPYPPSSRGQTYYHVTTLDNAKRIMMSGKIMGSHWEAGRVFAWKHMPSDYAIENSGAKFGTTISFKTGASFIKDTGIDDPKVTIYEPVVSFYRGPISVWDVRIVRVTDEN